MRIKFIRHHKPFVPGNIIEGDDRPLRILVERKVAQKLSNREDKEVVKEEEKEDKVVEKKPEEKKISDSGEAFNPRKYTRKKNKK